MVRKLWEEKKDEGIMRKKVVKWFWAWDFEKEEKWLNEMAAKGLVLVAVGFCQYTFEECSPDEYSVRLELLENVPAHAESENYIEFIEQTGAEYLGSIMRWVYFRRKTDNGEFDLYSDNASRIKHLNRILALLGVACILNICIGFGNIGIHFGTGFTISSNIGIINLSLGIFLAYGCLRVLFKKRKLIKQQRLFE